MRRRPGRYWSFVVWDASAKDELYASSKWSAVLPHIVYQKFTSRQAALDALDTAINEYMKAAATEQELAGTQWVKDFNASTKAMGISLS